MIRAKRIPCTLRNKKRLACAFAAGAILILGGCGAASGSLGVGQPENSNPNGTEADSAPKGNTPQDTCSGEKQQISLGCLGGSFDEELRRVIEAYNARNGQYYVELADYSEGAADTKQAQDRMMMELANGKGPDLLDMRELNKEELGAAGVLVDLYSFQSKAEWQERIDANLLTSIQTGESLYAIAPRFRIRTVAVGEQIGGTNGWTMEELLDAFQAHGKGPEALAGFYSDLSVLETLAMYEMDSYIDWEQGQADFARKSFYRLLEFDKAYRERNQTHIPRGIALRSEDRLASLENFFNVQAYQLSSLYYNGHMVIKGFPTPEGTGVGMSMDNPMGICATGNRAGAWDFLQFYLEEYGKDNGTGFFLDRQRREEEFALDMTEDLDTEGHPIPKASYDEENGILYIYAASPEDIAAVRDMISLVDRESVYNKTILQILAEEANSYASGSASAETVAQNCNNRVNLYLAELGGAQE